MAKARRGRIALPRTRNTEFATNSKASAERKFKHKLQLISDAFYNARQLKDNEAKNLARYLLGLFDLGDDVQTSVWCEGTGYDYKVSVQIGDAILELIQNKAEPLKIAA